MISTLLAVVGRSITRGNYKIVCDPRSVYVEECVITKTFRYNGFNYKLWKILEGFLYRKCDACIGLSPYFVKYLKQFNKSSFFVPALVKTESVYSATRRYEVRSKYGLDENDIVCCYIGSIDLWHSSEKLIYYFDQILQIIPKEKRFKVVFLSGNQKVCEILKKNMVLAY